MRFKLGQGHTIAFGNIRHGLVQLVIADAHAGTIRQLHLDGLGNQLLQHPLLKHLPWWQPGTLGFEATGNGVHSGFQLTLQNDVVLHDGNYLVQQFALCLHRQRCHNRKKYQ